MRNNSITTDKKRRAKHLIVNKGMSQRAAASELKVTEKTMGRWVKEYGWIAKSERELREQPKTMSLIDFAVFVREQHPRSYKKVRLLIDHFTAVS